MKTPEEIKKGLEICIGTCRGDKTACPYRMDFDLCLDIMNSDALAYIQQLEADKVSLLESSHEMRKDMCSRIQQLEAKAGLADQYRWERDVAIDQLEQLGIGFGEKVESKAPKWISVEERLPEAGKFVLLQYAKNAQNPTLHARNTMAVGRYEYGMFLVEGCSVKITHWMPLPEPPEV